MLLSDRDGVGCKTSGPLPEALSGSLQALTAMMSSKFSKWRPLSVNIIQPGWPSCHHAAVARAVVAAAAWRVDAIAHMLQYACMQMHHHGSLEPGMQADVVKSSERRKSLIDCC